MSEQYFTEEVFKGIQQEEEPLVYGDYENCRFINCNFAKADLSEFSFVECEFENCDLSSCKLFDTTIRDVFFKGCKMLGLHFEHCNTFIFSAEFQECQLNFSSFYQMKVRNSRFADCSLQEVDFSKCDLEGTTFENSDLTGAVFIQSILKKTDFSTALNYRLDPEQNKVQGAKFSLHGLPGLLDKYEVEII